MSHSDRKRTPTLSRSRAWIRSSSSSRSIGFDQVIIGVETKTAGLGLNVIPGADGEQRDVFVDAADALRKFIAVRFPAS